MSNDDTWDKGATYYDSEDAENLTHNSIEDYFTSLVDFVGEIDAPITVCAWRRREVSDSWIDGVAESLVERLTEGFGEEYGDPEGDSTGEWNNDGLKQLEKTFAAAIRKAIDEHAQVWACEKIGSRSFTLDEIKALVPELFEEGDSE